MEKKIIVPGSMPAEKQKELLRSFKAKSEARGYVKSVLDRVFPQEEKADSMTINPSFKRFAFRPNNYRLKIPFKPGSNSQTRSKGSLCPFPMEISSKNIRTYRVSKSLVIQAFRTCVIPIYSFKDKKGGRAWFEIKAVNSNEFDVKTDTKELEIINYMLNSVSKIGFVGLDYSSAYWVKQEFELKGDEFIDSLPRDLIMHDTYFKKVYPKGIEFKSSSYAKNYISNRSFEPYAPLIAKELAMINDKLNATDPCGFIRKFYAGIQDVLIGGKLHNVWITLSSFQKNVLLSELT